MSMTSYTRLVIEDHTQNVGKRPYKCYVRANTVIGRRRCTHDTKYVVSSSNRVVIRRRHTASDRVIYRSRSLRCVIACVREGR